jgi:hypothetical protein
MHTCHNTYGCILTVLQLSADMLELCHVLAATLQYVMAVLALVQ